MTGLDVTRNDAHGGCDDGGVIGKAQGRNEVGDEVGWNDEIGNSCQQDAPYPGGCFGIDGAIISRQQVLRKGDAPDYTVDFLPKAAADKLFVFADDRR